MIQSLKIVRDSDDRARFFVVFEQPLNAIIGCSFVITKIIGSEYHVNIEGRHYLKGRVGPDLAKRIIKATHHHIFSNRHNSGIINKMIWHEFFKEYIQHIPEHYRLHLK